MADDPAAAVVTAPVGWITAICCSLGLIGLAQFSVIPSDTQPRSAISIAGMLARLGAIGWAAVTNDLLVAGAAWELAELARWMTQAGESHGAARSSRERVRHIVSSTSFWLGAMLCVILTRTTRLGSISAQLAAAVPRSDEGQILGTASKLGFAAAILLCSAAGIRCGLLPWSFGRQDLPSNRRCGPVLLDQWLGQLLCLTMLVQFVLALGNGYGGPLAIMLAISAAGTALWNGLSVIGEMRATPVLQAIIAHQFAGIVLVTAVLAANPVAVSSGFPEQFDRSQLLKVAGWGILTLSLAICGLAALVQRIGEPQYGELFLDQYRGLFTKRKFEAIFLTALLISLVGRWPQPGFWSGWISLTSLVMLPQPLSDNRIQTHPVLLAAAVVCLISGMLLLERTAYWIRCVTLDPPASLPCGSGRRWDLALAGGAVGLGTLAAFSPQLLIAMIFGSA